MQKIVENAVKRAREMKNKDDSELEKFYEGSKAIIKVIGAGGAGGNTIQRLYELGVEGATLYALNTDAQALINIMADKKILIGKKTTRGLGAGSDPAVGEAAAKESEEEIRKELEGTDLLFLTCGLGGGTGTGALPVVAELARDMGILTIAVVTLPFTVEGKVRMENAMQGLERLRKAADTIIIIPNDKILELAPDLPINTAFKVADEVLANAVKGIVELITKPGLINLDFADLRNVIRRGGVAMIGLGESDPNAKGEERALQAIETALTSPLLDIDISTAKRALVNVVGGEDLSLKEAKTIVDVVASKIDPDAHIIWGATIDKDLEKGVVKAMVVIVGGKIPFLDYGEEKVSLDIDYME